MLVSPYVVMMARRRERLDSVGNEVAVVMLEARRAVD
jgi:hypothetical protein